MRDFQAIIYTCVIFENNDWSVSEAASMAGITDKIFPESRPMQSLSRAFILRWLQGLGVSLSRIEDVGKGVALCRILKMIDGSFPRFKEDPQTRNDYLGNLQLVKQYLERKGIKLYFPIERMVNMKMQDNLEVIQWFYKYWTKEMAPESETVFGNVQDQTKRENAVSPSEEGASSLAKWCVPCIRTAIISHLDNQELSALRKDMDEMRHTIVQKQMHIEKIQECAKVFQSERDFYFNKLLMIERLLKDGSYEITNETKKDILKMMYQN